jgi:hypothetical protein
MPIDPKDYLSSAYLTLDPLKVTKAMHSAISIARTDPTAGLGAAISTSVAMRDLINPASTLFGSDASNVIDPASSLASLSMLRAPYDLLSALPITDPYRGTMSSLASVAGVADSMRAAYAPLTVAGSIGSLTAPASAAALTVGVTNAFSHTRSIAAAYISSAASVYTVESTLARVTSVVAGSAPLFASTILAGISLGSLGHLHDTVSSLSHAAQTVWGGIGHNPSLLGVAPPVVLRSPAVELYSSAHAAAAVSFQREALPETDDEVEAFLEDTAETIEARLAVLDHDLLEIYRGGVGAIEAGGPDWQRHSMTSFRELSTHVLHKLAPDEEVIAITGVSGLHDGRPTRRARLAFIFSGVAGGELTAFFEADLKAAIELFDLLNGGTHKLGNRATPEQLYYLKGRLVGLISSMLSARGY